MEALLEILLEAAGELLFELVLQLVFELGARVLLAPFRTFAASLRTPWFALAGAAAGAVSLAVAPHAWLARPWLRVANLVLSPLLAGGAVAALGAFRARRGLVVLPLDRFVGGFAFALAFALVRFAFALRG
jgi:hypothetical protein